MTDSNTISSHKNDAFQKQLLWDTCNRFFQENKITLLDGELMMPNYPIDEEEIENFIGQICKIVGYYKE